jgi:hypothetical protein
MEILALPLLLILVICFCIWSLTSRLEKIEERVRTLMVEAVQDRHERDAQLKKRIDRSGIDATDWHKGE